MKVISLSMDTSYFDELRRKQSSVIRSAYKLAQNGSERSFIERIMNQRYANYNLDGHLLRSGVKKGMDIFGLQEVPDLCFGSRKNLGKLNRNEITKEEWKRARLHPLYSIGQAKSFGNRRFRLTETELVYVEGSGQTKTEQRFPLPKLKSNWQKILNELIALSNNKELALTYTVDDEFVHIIYDETKLETFKKKYPKYEPTHWRVLGIDTNPDRIGISIWDRNTKEILHSEVIEFRMEQGHIDSVEDQIVKLRFELDYGDHSKKQKYELRKKLKKLYNRPIVSGKKLKHETSIICDYIAKLCANYQVSRISVEKIQIESKDHKKGQKTNRKINNLWQRRFLFSKLSSIANILEIKYVEVNAAYSSFIGNLLHPELPDAAAAAVEIARRGITLYEKNMFYPKLIKKSTLEHRWKEMAGVEYEDWKELYAIFKNLKLEFRSHGVDVVSSRFMSAKSRAWQMCRSNN